VLRREGKDTSLDFEEVASRAVALGDLPVVSDQGVAPSVSTTISLTGMTTFQDLLDAGYLLEDIEAITGKPTSLSMAIKDFVAEQGVEFSEIKAKLAELVPLQ